MSDLLLEIGLEEVPAKFMPPALAELKHLHVYLSEFTPTQVSDTLTIHSLAIWKQAQEVRMEII